MSMTLSNAREIAGQCWCDPRAESMTMIPNLAEVFSEKLFKEMSKADKPNLGMATTREIFDEIEARIEMEPGNLMDYRTTETDAERFDRMTIKTLAC